MKGLAKHKALTSGRLTGKVQTQATQRHPISNPRLAAFPERAYSLYSSDSQEQVASLHDGLDRYSALLSGILQADDSAGDLSVKDCPKSMKTSKDRLNLTTETGPVSDIPHSPRHWGEKKDAAVKSKLPSTPGRKIVKKAPAKPDRKSCHSTPHRAGIATPRITRHPMVPVAHSGVKLLPARRRIQNAPSRPQMPQHTPSTSQHPHLARKSGSKSQHASGRAECESGGEDLIPVRDLSPQRGNLKAQEKRWAEEVKDACSVDECSAEGEVKMQMVQYLLRELKALIIGEGSLAEMLLRRLEQAMTSPLVNTSIQSDADVFSLQSQNVQLRRQVEELQQQLTLKEKAKKVDDLCSSQVSVVQQDLTAALSQLRELQDNLTDLQKAHQDTQNQLRDKEMINTLIISDLEATRNRLLDSEREKGELATQYQQRLKEVEHLKRDLQSRFSSDCTFVGSSGSHSPGQHRADPSEEATKRIAHYLMSMEQPEATAKNDGQTTIQQGGQPAENSTQRSPRLDLEPGVHEDLPFGSMSSCSMSQCEVESVWSDYSLQSGSTLDARDEAAFRDGLSALDTTMANLLKSIQLDRSRMLI